MVDYEKFHKILDVKAPSQIPRRQGRVEDGFEWQQDVIESIKKFVKSSKLSAIDAFRYFDHDCDGRISKSDMKTSLERYLLIPAEKIDDHRLARLFRLLSFYKADSLQPSDFDRLLVDANPFLTASQGSVKANFTKSMGGGFATTSTHDWKLAAIQQIGLVISRNYESIEAGFGAASNHTDKVNFEKFKAFIEKHNALQGFNITLPLL